MEIETMTFDEKVKFFSEKQKEIVDLNGKLQTLTNEYRNEIRTAFGLADGDKYDVLNLIRFIRDIHGHA